MLQTGEIIVIALLALVILGPTRLPDIARKMGRWTMELRNAARDITRGLESEVQEFKEAGEELRAPMKEVRDEVKKPFSEIRDEVSGFGRGGHEWKGPKPVSGPTPEDAMRDLEEINRGVEEETEPSVDDPSDDAPLPGSAGTPPDGPSALGGETGDTSPDRPSASPPPLPDGDTSPDAPLGEETASQGEETGHTDETRE
ncbi:MAG: twin-arginine translocase TatA/TatE family subunit [Actinomycetota bacterium]